MNNSLILTGTRGSLTDDDVRKLLYEIVNHPTLCKWQKLNWLDALQVKTSNCHEHGLAANIIEDICNEGTHLLYPSWKGRHGDWVSVER